MHKLAIVFLLTATAAFANPSGHLSVLVPINPGSLPGAFGTQWATKLWITNLSSADTTVVCDTFPNDCPVLKANSTTALDAPPYASAAHGFFMEIPVPFFSQTGQSNIWMSLRTSDSGTAPKSAGIEIPLVRVQDFNKNAFALPAVPANDHSRSRLRVYGIGNGQVTVRVVGLTTNQELLNVALPLTGGDAPASNFFGVPEVKFPSYAELALPDFSASDSMVRVEITPGGGLLTWGFVSVTDDGS
ncbi:MAG TPA: hypothetical protein VI258_03815, partial [Rhodanobacteraceae bacterium]